MKRSLALALAARPRPPVHYLRWLRAGRPSRRYQLARRLRHRRRRRAKLPILSSWN